MKTKLYNYENRYIPTVRNYFKVFFKILINDFRAGFSTVNQISKLLMINTQNRFSTYQHRYNHHHILKIKIYICI